ARLLVLVNNPGKLAQGLRNQFFIVHYSIRNVLNLFDLSYVDVVLSMGLELIRKATSDKVPVTDGMLQRLLDFTRQISTDVETGGKSGAELGGELNFVVAKLSSK